MRVKDLEVQLQAMGTQQAISQEEVKSLSDSLTSKDAEIAQWRIATESRDEVIAWLESQPTKIIEVFSPPIEVIKEIPVIKQVLVYTQPKEWQSLEQFETMFKGATTSFAPYTCLTIAEQIQSAALEQGYSVSIGLAYCQSYYGLAVTNSTGYHAGVVINVKGTYYFIDPIPWRVTRLF
jgi:hypothetical protein